MQKLFALALLLGLSLPAPGTWAAVAKLRVGFDSQGKWTEETATAGEIGYFRARAALDPDIPTQIAKSDLHFVQIQYCTVYQPGPDDEPVCVSSEPRWVLQSSDYPLGPTEAVVTTPFVKTKLPGTLVARVSMNPQLNPTFPGTIRLTAKTLLSPSTYDALPALSMMGVVGHRGYLTLNILVVADADYTWSDASGSYQISRFSLDRSSIDFGVHDFVVNGSCLRPVCSVAFVPVIQPMPLVFGSSWESSTTH